MKVPRTSTFAVIAIVVLGFWHCSCAVGQDEPREQGQSHDGPAEETAWKQHGSVFGWTKPAAMTAITQLQQVWTVDVGEGRGQVVGEAETAFVAGLDVTTNETQLVTRISAIDVASGEIQWSSLVAGPMRDNQETFGGAARGPQCTPLLAEGFIIVIDFSGIVHGLSQETGALVWERDLVEQDGADPVQFGFSSSPVIDPQEPNQCVILAGGAAGGLLKLDISTGKLIWKSPVESFGYATPVETTFGGIRQWVVVSRRWVAGIRQSDGERLWEWPLPEIDLTNVPTPLILSDDRLLVACQGTQGTRCLEVQRRAEQWAIVEQWHQSRLNYFYTNWLTLSDLVVIGCTDDFLAAFDVDTGDFLGRFRGFSDGNMIRRGNQVIAINGRGTLATLEFNQEDSGSIRRLEYTRRFQLPDGRYWTAPSLVGSRILVREGTRLMGFSGKQESAGELIRNSLASPEELELSNSAEALVSAKIVDTIIATFDAQGREAAMQVYDEYRARNELTELARLQLIESADAAGLKEVGDLIMRHALKDLPDSLKLRSMNDRREDDQ